MANSGNYPQVRRHGIESRDENRPAVVALQMQVQHVRHHARENLGLAGKGLSEALFKTGFWPAITEISSKIPL